MCYVPSLIVCIAQGHARLRNPGTYAEIESGLTWLGVAGLQDPPRGEVRGAIRQCSQAGVRVRNMNIRCQVHRSGGNFDAIIRSSTTGFSV